MPHGYSYTVTLHVRVDDAPYPEREDVAAELDDALEGLSFDCDGHYCEVGSVVIASTVGE